MTQTPCPTHTDGDPDCTSGRAYSPDKAVCPVCRHNIAVDDKGKFWAHGDRWGCSMSGKPVETAPARTT